MWQPKFKNLEDNFLVILFFSSAYLFFFLFWNKYFNAIFSIFFTKTWPEIPSFELCTFNLQKKLEIYPFPITRLPTHSPRRSILCCLATLWNGRSQRISARASSAKGAGATGKYYSAAAAWENVSLWPSGISCAA